MGSGYSFRCSKCGCEYDAWLGIGYLFPSEYREAVSDIEAGKYGEEIRQTFLETQYAAVDFEKDLFVCKCGNWTVENNMDLYSPNDVEEVKKLNYGEHDVEGWGYIPCVMKHDLKEHFTLLRHWPHMCKKCGREMKQIKNPDYYVRRYGLRCPDCGEKNFEEQGSRILWD